MIDEIINKYNICSKGLTICINIKEIQRKKKFSSPKSNYKN